MKQSICLMLASSLAASCSAASSQPSETDAAVSEYNEVLSPDPLPVEIRGLWAEKVEGCDDEYDTSRMKIGVNWISFHESFGLMQISTPAGIPDLDKSIAASFVMSGEGGTWPNEFVFGWKGSTPKVIYLIESKAEDSISRERRRYAYVRCD